MILSGEIDCRPVGCSLSLMGKNLVKRDLHAIFVSVTSILLDCLDKQEFIFLSSRSVGIVNIASIRHNK